MCFTFFFRERYFVGGIYWHSAFHNIMWILTKIYEEDTANLIVQMRFETLRGSSKIKMDNIGARVRKVQLKL